MRYHTDLEKIILHVYAVTATFVIVIIFLGTFLYLLTSGVKSIEQRLSFYHLPSIADINQLLLETNQILADIEISNSKISLNSEQLENRQHSWLRALTEDLNDQLYFMETTVNELHDRHSAFSDAITDRALQRMVQRQQNLHILLNLPSGEKPSVTNRSEVLEMATALSSSLDQLRRLHLRQVELLTDKLANYYENNNKLMVLVGFITFALTALVIYRILLLIRKILKEQKHTQTELANYRDHLEQLVEERTAKLAAVNKELEAYNYSVAHDLRSPLRAMTSYSEILLMDAADKLNQEEKHFLQRIIAGGKQMAQLIDDLLQLASVSLDEIRISEINLSELADQAITQLQHTEPREDVSVTIEANLTASASRSLITLVLNNLLDNAWKYTRHTKNTHIQMGQSVLDGKKAFFVRDNGAGFDMRYADKIFHSFHRLHAAHEYEGTGIGLAIVERVIQRHKGEVWIESEVNQGTTCYFTLPQDHAQQPT